MQKEPLAVHCKVGGESRTPHKFFCVLLMYFKISMITYFYLYYQCIVNNKHSLSYILKEINSTCPVI